MSLKRLRDIVASAVGLLVLSPLLGLIAVAVWIEDKGAIFYHARRVGRKGAEFNLLKFRSMVMDADRQGGMLTRADDPRISRVGRFLRALKLDELPQLWNVLKGDMSLCGPRPEDPRYVALYSEEQRMILDYRPGITSPASLRFRKESELLTDEGWEERYTREILPEKLDMDLTYFESASFWSDIRLIVMTLVALVRR